MTEGNVLFSSLIDYLVNDSAVYDFFGPRPDMKFSTDYPKFNETNYGLLQYNLNARQYDVYAEYYNPTYPWIEVTLQYNKDIEVC